MSLHIGTPPREGNLLTVGWCCLSLAVLIGALLLARPARRLADVHGLCAVAGTVLICAAGLQGRLHIGAASQAGGVAVGLLLAALCGGVLLWRGWRAGLLVFLHAMAGGTAYLLLAGAVLG